MTQKNNDYRDHMTTDPLDKRPDLKFFRSHHAKTMYDQEFQGALAKVLDIADDNKVDIHDLCQSIRFMHKHGF